MCEEVGADAKEVERGLKSEGRIGPRAYLSPGAAFAGGTLARDLRFLVHRGEDVEVATPLLQGVLASNEVHKHWVREHVERLLTNIAYPIVTVLGLTYKAGTSTLRRSSAIELCLWLNQRGVCVRGYDPAVSRLPKELDGVVELTANALEALNGSHLAVIATEWPSFRNLRTGRCQCRACFSRAFSIRTTISRTYWTAIRASAISPPASMPLDCREGIAMSLRGRSAIITGSNQGLGFAIARRFVDSGASVLLAARDAERLRQAEAELNRYARPGQIVVSQAGDVVAAGGLSSHCQSSLETLPNLMILVNNAGVYGPIGRIEDNDWDEWVQATQINLFGTVLMCRAILPHLRATGLWQDHQSIRRRSNVAAAPLQCLCRIQGGGCALHRNAGRGSARTTSM